MCTCVLCVLVYVCMYVCACVCVCVCVCCEQRRLVKRQLASDVTIVLVAQLKMAYVHSDINTCDRRQVCKSCGQDTELDELGTVYKLGGKSEKRS